LNVLTNPLGETRTLLLAVLSICIFLPCAVAAGTKIDVCHVPPGNPDNYHTISINDNALSAHVAHGDLLDSCNALCANLCDDGDACTIDDTGDCEIAGCPVERLPVDCDDSNACTSDSCDSLDGCINTEVVVCQSGEICNPETAICEPDGGPVITEFSVVTVGRSSITLRWMTDIPATSQLFFRLEGVGSFELGADDPDLETEHFIVLPTPFDGGLDANTDYELFARSASTTGASSDSNVIMVRTRR